MPFSYDEIARYQWLTATQTVTLAEAEVARMIYWCKSPNQEAVPDLVEMISLWEEAHDCSNRLDQAPVVIDEEIREELAETGVLSIEDVRNKCVELDAFMAASEQFQSVLYQKTLEEQLRYELASWRECLERIGSTKLDDEELEGLLSTRDYLEYARMGIHVIRMSRRLLSVNYSQFAKELARLDERFSDILKQYDKQLLPYAPSTAWWRKA